LSIRKLPDYRLKQKILYVDQTDPEILQDYGDLFFAEGNLSDALDFYQKAIFTEGLQKVKKSSLEGGDVMLFQRVTKALNLEITPADWENIGQKAMSLKKYLFARHALEKANNEGLLNSLKQITEAEEHEKST
jgi:tetratricopeptide (TPR) repeat protein